MQLGPRLVLTVLVLSTVSGIRGDGFDFDHWYKYFLANNALMWLIKLIPKSWEKRIMRVVRVAEKWVVYKSKRMARRTKDCAVAVARGMMAWTRGKEFPPVLDV